MNAPIAALVFSSRESFRDWLTANAGRDAGVWLAFTKGNKSFTANDALEEAICFGWIDGVMKSIDDRTYRKYFSRRKDRSNWSDKNRGIFNRMAKDGLMTEAGIAAYRDEPKLDKPVRDTDAAIRTLRAALPADALSLFDTKPSSRQKQLGLFYCDAKTEAIRTKRLAKITETLKTNYTGMLY